MPTPSLGMEAFAALVIVAGLSWATYHPGATPGRAAP